MTCFIVKSGVAPLSGSFSFFIFLFLSHHVSVLPWQTFIFLVKDAGYYWVCVCVILLQFLNFWTVCNERSRVWHSWTGPLTLSWSLGRNSVADICDTVEVTIADVSTFCLCFLQGSFLCSSTVILIQNLYMFYNLVNYTFSQVWKCSSCLKAGCVIGSGACVWICVIQPLFV